MSSEEYNAGHDNGALYTLVKTAADLMRSAVGVREHIVEVNADIDTEDTAIDDDRMLGTLNELAGDLEDQARRILEDGEQS